MKEHSTIDIGTRQAINFVRKHHGMVMLPRHELFAFAQNVDAEDEVYAVVSESEKASEPDRIHAKKLGIGEYYFTALVASPCLPHLPRGKNLSTNVRFPSVYIPRGVVRFSEKANFPQTGSLGPF